MERTKTNSMKKRLLTALLAVVMLLSMVWGPGVGTAYAVSADLQTVLDGTFLFVPRHPNGGNYLQPYIQTVNWGDLYARVNNTIIVNDALHLAVAHTDDGTNPISATDPRSVYMSKRVIYCIDANTGNDDTAPHSAFRADEIDDYTTYSQYYQEILWIVTNGFQLYDTNSTNLADLQAASGISSLTDADAMIGTQYALWCFAADTKATSLNNGMGYHHIGQYLVPGVGDNAKAFAQYLFDSANASAGSGISKTSGVEIDFNETAATFTGDYYGPITLSGKYQPTLDIYTDTFALSASGAIIVSSNDGTDAVLTSVSSATPFYIKKNTGISFDNVTVTAGASGTNLIPVMFGEKVNGQVDSEGTQVLVTLFEDTVSSTTNFNINAPTPPPLPPQATDALVLKKEVAGTNADRTKHFKFEVTFTAASATDIDKISVVTTPVGIPVSRATGTDWVKFTLELAHGEYVTFNDIATGTDYTIVENDYSADSYTSDKTNNTVAGSVSSSINVTFVNTYKDTTPNPEPTPPTPTPPTPPTPPNPGGGNEGDSGETYYPTPRQPVVPEKSAPTETLPAEDMLPVDDEWPLGVLPSTGFSAVAAHYAVLALVALLAMFGTGLCFYRKKG